jgi:hypothetical protein
MGNTVAFAHHKVDGERTHGYFWIVFPDGAPDRLYARENDSSNAPESQVRRSADGNNCGGDGLTKFGRALFDALSVRTSVEDPTPRNFEIWSDDPDSRIRVQVADDWQRVTPEQCEAAIRHALEALDTVFGSSISIESGRYADIS